MLQLVIRGPDGALCLQTGEVAANTARAAPSVRLGGQMFKLLRLLAEARHDDVSAGHAVTLEQTGAVRIGKVEAALWGDGADCQAKLRTLVSRTRGLLAEAVGARPDRAIVSTGTAYRLSASLDVCQREEAFPAVVSETTPGSPRLGVSQVPPPPIASLPMLDRADSEASRDHLAACLDAATASITLFGLTRGAFIGDDRLREGLLRAAMRVPVRIFVMSPDAASRPLRYRIEPLSATLEDPARFRRRVLVPLLEVAREVTEAGGVMQVWTFDFPTSFAIDRFDDLLRVTFYGAGVRGTEGPLLALSPECRGYDYFRKQVDWLEALAERGRSGAWSASGIALQPA